MKPSRLSFWIRRQQGASDSPISAAIAAVDRLKARLIALGEWSEERHAALAAELTDEVKAATKEAEGNGILGHGLHHPFHTIRHHLIHAAQ